MRGSVSCTIQDLTQNCVLVNFAPMLDGYDNETNPRDQQQRCFFIYASTVSERLNQIRFSLDCLRCIEILAIMNPDRQSVLSPLAIIAIKNNYFC
jgi:hypothetical protein